MVNPKIRFKADNGEEYSEWKTKTFGNAFAPLNNNTFSRDMLNYDKGVAKNIHYGDILIKYEEICNVAIDVIPYVNSDIQFNKYDSLQNGDIILADTAEDETVGKAIELYGINKEVIISGLHTMPCRPMQKYAPMYLGYLLNSPAFHNQLLPYIQGIKVSSIGRKNIANTTLSYPCLSEQQKIANFLSTVDEVITQSEKEVQNLEQQKKAIMQKIFSREIHFKNDDGTEFPEWEEKTIGEYCDILDNMRKPITKKDRKPGIYPYYGSTNIQDYIDDYIFDEPLVLLGEDSAPFMDFKEKPIAQLATGKFWVNNHAHCLRPHGNVAFFYYSIVHKDIREYINNPSRAKLNQEDMLKIPIPVPCLAEQQKIANFLSIFDKAISYAKQELDKWKELKKGLLQQMFV